MKHTTPAPARAFHTYHVRLIQEMTIYFAYVSTKQPDSGGITLEYEFSSKAPTSALTASCKCWSIATGRHLPCGAAIAVGRRIGLEQLGLLSDTGRMSHDCVRLKY